MGSVCKRNFTVQVFITILLGICVKVAVVYAMEVPEVYVQLGHTDIVSSVAFSPDGRFVVSGGGDGTLRLWDLFSGKEVVRMASFTNGEWIALTPEGYYTASAGGDAHLLVRFGNQVYSIDQYRSALYRPDVVEAVLQGRDIADVLSGATGTSKVTPTSISALQTMEPPFLVIKSPEEGQRIQGLQTDLSLYVEDRNHPIRQVRVFVNGRGEGRQGERGIEVVGVAGEQKRVLELKVPITLDRGENLIEVVASNGFSETRKQVRFQAVEGSSALGNEDLLPNLLYLSKASAKDVVLLFLAGHGVNDERGDFYFLPADSVILEDGSFRKSRAIPWREFKALLDLPARKLIFADTCHSEGLRGNKTRGADNDRFVRELQEAHAVIFTSSRGKQLSQESDRLGHGVFTYAILEGLRGKADLIKDGKVSMKELDTYVSETVPRLTNGAQHPITHTPEGYVNFTLGVVE